MRFTLITIVLALTAVVHAQGIEHFIDPVAGIDAAGRGTATQPFKTLTYAASRSFVPGSVPTLTLRAGVYGTASGEVFPINLPERSIVQADPATTTRSDQQVVFDLGSAKVSAFSLVTKSVSSVLLEGLRIEGVFGSGLQVRVQTGTAASGDVRARNCNFAVDEGIRITVGLSGTLSLFLSEVEFVSTDTAVRVVTEDGAVAQAFVDRSTLVGGQSGIVFDSQKGGVVTSSLRAVRMIHMSSVGVHSQSGNGAFMAHTFEHCLFHDLGNTVTGLGAVVDAVSVLGLQPRYRILNGIFDNNRLDAANGADPSYIWGANLVQQASLSKLGRNRVGKATFVSSFDDDFHLAPGSSGIDEGLGQDVSLYADFDGDPRMLLGATPDLGPDEYYDWYVYAHAEQHIREILRLRTTTPIPNVPFGLIMSLSRRPGSFGAGQFHLAGTMFATMTGSTSKAGIGEVVTILPPDPNLIGLELFWQGGFLAAPYFGVNAWRTVFLK